MTSCRLEGNVCGQVSDKEPVSSIYKECSKLNHHKTTSWKWAQDLNRRLTGWEAGKRAQVMLSIISREEMQIKTTMGF